MPIDEVVLESKITEYSAKADICQKKYQAIMAVVSQLSAIRQIRTGVVDDVPVMEDPTDRGTGKTITSARRQEVYDENVALGDILPQ